MKISIQIPTPLRVYTNNEKLVHVEASSVVSALQLLTEQFTRWRAQLYDKDRLRSYVNVYLNDEDIR